MFKFLQTITLALTAILLTMVPVSAASTNFPTIIPLPDGFQPEGIAVGRGSTFFAGSLVDGAIYRGDLRTGAGEIFVPGVTGTVSVGMAFDERSNALFVAGGPTGAARVFDADSGKLLETYPFAEPGNFINDVIVTRDAAYFTNSTAAVLYRLPLGPGGSLPPADGFEVLPLSGDWVQQEGVFNANGIEATADGAWLVVVHTPLGKLFRVDPTSGETVAIDLAGESVSGGDGLLFRGGLLYVLRNTVNELVTIDLSNDLTSGVVLERVVDPNFDVATTLAAFGDALYAVNAKFSTPPTPDTPYEIVRVPLR